MLALVRLGRRAGEALADIARALGLLAGTVRGWWRRWVGTLRSIGRRGRAQRRNRALERALLRAFYENPILGARTMHRQYPEVPRWRIERIRERALALREAQSAQYKLTWTEPGAVWAMDFKKPPRPVEGVYVGVLVVRDLASGETLEAVATRTLQAKEVAAVASLQGLRGRPRPRSGAPLARLRAPPVSNKRQALPSAPPVTRPHGGRRPPRGWLPHRGFGPLLECPI